KYGLAVVGTVHPDKVITNSQSKAGDILILTKPLGMGIITAGKRLDEVRDEDYQRALDYMKLLNKNGAELMQKYNVKAATDITGFSLLGHALKMCKASNVSMEIDSSSLPVLAGAYELADMGCLPGAAFRNQDFAEPDILLKDPDYNLKMIGFDAQTSGGLLISSPPNIANQLLQELRDNLYPDACIIGKVTEKKNKHIELS
ncbi:MAG: selenide, water dikinase SelD, partial [Candidatus Cloacimonetes bacterium]|nr:selenide, water dikinase SelD [Candidatus Cloacimonadota bacterium]